MRVLMIVKASKESEAGVMPTQDLLMEMGSYNEQLVKAGAMLDGAGLDATSKGARIKFSGSDRVVQRGPFPNPEDQIAGYWVINVKSMDEAIEWARKIPFRDGTVELRRLTELEDFEQGEAMDRMRDLKAEMESKRA